MQRARVCPGCGHTLSVPVEFASIPNVCPKCGKVVHSPKTKRWNAIAFVARHLILGSLLFLVGLGIASGFVEDRPNTYNQQPSRAKRKPIPIPFKLQESQSSNQSDENKLKRHESLLRQLRSGSNPSRRQTEPSSSEGLLMPDQSIRPSHDKQLNHTA